MSLGSPKPGSKLGKAMTSWLKAFNACVTARCWHKKYKHLDKIERKKYKIVENLIIRSK